MQWLSDDLRTRVVFDPDGIKGWQDGVMVADRRWARVRDLDIKVPYSSRRTVAALTLLDVIGPRTFSYSASAVELSFTARYDVVQWTLATDATYNSRVQFILDDLTRLLDPDFSPMGSPGVLDDAVRHVAPRMRPHSRLLLYTDFFGLDRYLGGHGAFDADLHTVLDHQMRK